MPVGCCRSVELNMESSVCRIMPPETEPILQFFLIDLKSSPARSTHTSLTSTLQENFLPFRGVNWNYFKYTGFKGTSQRAQQCFSLPLCIVSSVISKISILFMFYDGEMEIVKWLLQSTHYTKRRAKNRVCIFWLPAWWFLPLGPIAFQTGLELLYTLLFTKNGLKKCLHLDITGNCFHPSRGQESPPGTMTK